MDANPLQILQHYKIEASVGNDGKITVLCPFHDDHNPSGNIDINTHRYNCWSCRTQTTLYHYIAKKLGKSTSDIYYELGANYTKKEKEVIDAAAIERAHVDLFRADYLLEQLRKRCVTADTIRRYRLGSMMINRISIPVRNKAGVVVNVRLYTPGATKNKFINLLSKKGSQSLLYPYDQLVYDTMLICGGEIKALAAIPILNPLGIGCVTTITGEQYWDVKLNGDFVDKKVYVCNDIDQPGKQGAENRCRALRKDVEALFKVDLPLDVVQFPKGDLNDFLAIGGDLPALLEHTPKWEMITDSDVNEEEEPCEVTLSEAVCGEYAKKRVSFKASVSSIDTAPYSVPREVEVKCLRKESFCSICPVFINHDPAEQVLTIKAEQDEILEMVGGQKVMQANVIKRALGIPPICRSCTFNPLTFYNIEDVRLSTELDLTNRTDERDMQVAYCVGSGKLELNGLYHMTGRMYPHPMTQQSALLISDYVAARDALESYTPSNLDELDIFKPKRWEPECIEEKLADLYGDFVSNVTGIKSRQDMHLAYDLVYHTPLFLTLENARVKGWGELLVVGDSSQGKSEIMRGLLNHYKLGAKVDCKGATEAGLKGGCERTGKRWWVSWGAIPTYDRRLVFLEELKGADVEVISKLTDMRSSGVADITKIARRRAPARTRIIAISNSRSGRMVSEYSYGINIVKELIGNLEDIRRFDFIYTVDRREVDVDECQATKEVRPHVYTSELCRSLILLCWTVPNVVVEDEAYLLAASRKLCSQYVDEVPIVDRGSMRQKLARLAGGLAGRTASFEENKMVIRNCHIEYVTSYLDRLYKGALGYWEYSERTRFNSNLTEPKAILEKIRAKVAYPRAFADTCLNTDNLDFDYLHDTLGGEALAVRELISFLIRHNALVKDGKWYRKSTGFTSLLKTIQKENIPSHLENKF